MYLHTFALTLYSLSFLTPREYGVSMISVNKQIFSSARGVQFLSQGEYF